MRDLVLQMEGQMPAQSRVWAHGLDMAFGGRRPAATPAQVLASLMQAHGLTQAQLPEVGSQGVVSEVLAGKRRLNTRQLAALCRRFSVPADVLLP